MANKTSQIIDLLNGDEEITGREIAKRLKCTESFVSQVKSKINKTPAVDESIDETVDPTDEELETETSNFVKKIKIVPPPETLTETEDEPDTDEDYECGVCGYSWTAPKTEYQKGCPGCGEAF